MQLKIISLAAVIALAQSMPVASAESSDSPQQLAARLSLLNKQIAATPRTVDLLNKRAFLFVQLRRLKDAMQDLHVALGIDPNNFDSLLNQGIVYSYQQDDDKAMQSFTQALKFAKTNIDGGRVHFGMYQTTMEQGQYEQALDHINKCCQLSPPYFFNFFCRGKLYVRFGQYQNAVRDLDTSIKLKPTTVAYRERAKILSKLGQDQKAVEDLSKCIELTNESFDYELRGDSYQAIGEFQKAVADYSVALKRNRKHWAAVEQNRANAYEKWHKYDLALADYNELLAQDKDAGVLGYTNAVSYRSGRARIYEALGKHDLAEKDRAAAKKIEKENSQDL